jgi:hypothetical protein
VPAGVVGVGEGGGVRGVAGGCRRCGCVRGGADDLRVAAKLDTKLDCKLLLSIFLPQGKGSHSLYENTSIGVSGQHYYIAEC